MLPQSSGGTRGHPDDEQADVKDRARAATLASPARVVTPHAASSFRCETGVERDRVPSSGSRPTLSGRSYTGPSKPEARRCRSGSTRGSRPGRRLTKRGARHTVDVRQRPASARRSTGLSICLFRRAQTQRRRARAGDQARLILSGQLTQVLRSFRRSYLR
jgi:hypothetical protein